ncbi:hypothetical protein ROP_70620 [Rhodococcus opacus B4]|uniref:Nitroreductase domain-containing protein n=1 Tax=Rhodococcus opacus (strain B4) TaxID=632772 RepID=C1B4X0_RHOOB|nr:hypothetical protein ROP_70620 [Rhodococcus opacus B4]
MNSTIPDENVVRIAVDLACRAPSVHNSQPWEWTYTDGQLDLYTARGRVLASTDPTGRQLVVSCGAALHHLQTALTALKWAADVRRVPEGPHSGHLATIRFRHEARPQSHDFDLLAAIRHRHSDRRPFGPVSVKSPLPAALNDVVHRRDVHLTVLRQEARPVLARATETTAAARKYETAYQTELHWWAGHSIAQGGIPPTHSPPRTTGTASTSGVASPPAETPVRPRSRTARRCWCSAPPRTVAVSGSAPGRPCRRCCSRPPSAVCRPARSPT